MDVSVIRFRVFTSLVLGDPKVDRSFIAFAFFVINVIALYLVKLKSSKSFVSF